ncbi:hypothetical protein [Streptomyces cupreus]|uniref:hypothetical protein n=1 Tax=Streptomyces cupreus TaxID=2759956 RepID=UPI0021B22520|nr:hypothetical protein [Streptomyces cupreus]
MRLLTGLPGRKHRQNALLIAVDPAAFGDPDAAVADERAAQGIPVTPRVWRELTEAAEKFGLNPPA